ncbi:hypothetical protein CMV_009325 [Castanea mollissima]|uniref:Uncharacterized protein n=1 Tax=Castanea mollissima TaxID=60419 RepID=A0A8J4RI69_9ROSI|nr:hypothetical protein CMV_009325 [Castanea mollissima]
MTIPSGTMQSAGNGPVRSLDFDPVKANRVDTWLSHTVNSAIQRIQPELFGTEHFALPQFILSCKSMSFLSVKTNNSTLK